MENNKTVTECAADLGGRRFVFASLADAMARANRWLDAQGTHGNRHLTERAETVCHISQGSKTWRRSGGRWV